MSYEDGKNQEPEYHFLSEEFTERLRGQIGEFDLPVFAEKAVSSFGAEDYEVQELMGGLRFNLYGTPDMKKRGDIITIYHLEFWLSTRESKESLLVMSIAKNKEIDDKLRQKVESLGGQIRSSLVNEVHVPLDLERDGALDWLDRVHKTYNEIIESLA